MEVSVVDWTLVLVVVAISTTVVVKLLVIVLSVVVVHTVLYLVTVIVFEAGVTLTVGRVIFVTASGEIL